MTCAHCECENTKKHGKDRDGHQRFRCRDCGKTFLDKLAGPLGSMRIDPERAAFAVRLLLEGMSIRSTERMTGIHRDTLCSLVVTVGQNCERLMRRVVRNVPAEQIQCDELWSFVGCKERTRKIRGYGEATGDCYTFVAIDRETKLVLTFHAGKRDSIATHAFSYRLAAIVKGRPHVSTDGFKPYKTLIPDAFNRNVDFAQLVKKYGQSPDEGGPQRRYSPAQIIGIEETPVCGVIGRAPVCTSHVERMNLSIRMGVRRFTRLTNAFSKKWENHAAMLALFFAHYNFCKRHGTLRTTPAVAAGIAAESWTIERLLAEAAQS